MGAVLGDAGYQLIVAVDGRDAIRLFDKHAAEIDLAMLAVVMPGANGREVYEAIQAARPEIPVLFVSGYSFEHVETGRLPTGGFGVIRKPCTPAALLRRIREALDKAAEQEQRQRGRPLWPAALLLLRLFAVVQPV